MPFFNKAHLLRCRLTIKAPAHLTELMPFFNKAHLLRCRLTIKAPAHLTESAVGVDLDCDKGTVGIR